MKTYNRTLYGSGPVCLAVHGIEQPGQCNVPQQLKLLLAALLAEYSALAIAMSEMMQMP